MDLQNKKPKLKDPAHDTWEKILWSNRTKLWEKIDLNISPYGSNSPKCIPRGTSGHQLENR